MKNGDVKTYLQAHDSISTSLKLKWAYQVAEAVDLLHRNGIIHCDIKPRNLLLDTTFDIKIIDFSGSSLDGSKPASGEGTRDQPTVATDLFALGSTLYEIFQGTSPYEEIPSDQVEKLFTQEFPGVSNIYYVDKSSSNVGYLKLIQRRMCKLPSRLLSLVKST
ncbi:kinase domain-containing protein [Penicillium verrucosum]|uniref:kinase domain-containing protein n=1 Tax=Penicillium verrucosum TaxID=60171 RepID=UPI0025455800|nr:kinase domain-containing protein [Penicillium verrucosum]KAJ5944797.1 kinase domain-containing protein [Penicillium verrucosum]